MLKLEKEKNEYFAKIVHDLKTPIIAQIKTLESFLIAVENKISQEEKDLIELTLNSCNYMQKLIDIFNSVQKLDYEAIKLNYEKFNITNLINSLLDETKILLKYYQLEVIFDSKNDFIINADSLQIKRVIENLLSNSLNYAYKNTKIKIFLKKVKNNLIFEIHNKSPYIEEDILKEIFEKYKTHSTKYGTGGVGLGLYLSKEIIHAHFGEMFARSFEDDSNIFGFRIPID